jgi:cytochrome c biogenesis protein CcmG/thiol:disulfide interchange protein DsbE
MRYLLLIFLIFCIYIFYEGLKKDPKIIPSNLIYKKIPDFYIKGYDNSEFSVQDLQNKNVKIVNFFASWCPPCRIEHEQLKDLSQTVDLFGVAKKNKMIDLSLWLGELGNPYKRIGMDYQGLTSIEWGVYGLPETFVIDKDGIIKYRHVGPIMKRDLSKIKNIIESLR